MNEYPEHLSSTVDPYTGEPRQKVFSIRAIGLTSVFGGFIPALMLYGINWKRLGEPQKANASFIAVAAAILVLVGIFFAEMFYSLEIPTNIIRGVMRLTDWMLVFYFFTSQNKALEERHKTAPYASGWWAVLAVLVWTVTFLGLALLSGFSGSLFGLAIRNS